MNKQEFIEETKKFLENEVTCPYCGEIDNYATDDGWCYQDGQELESNCPHCYKKYLVYPLMDWSFTSRAIEDEITDEMIAKVLGGE